MQGVLLESMRNDYFHTVDTSLQSEWERKGGEGRGANAADAQLGALPSGHRCRVSPSSICEIATFLALKA